MRCVHVSVRWLDGVSVFMFKKKTCTISTNRLTYTYSLTQFSSELQPTHRKRICLTRKTDIFSFHSLSRHIHAENHIPKYFGKQHTNSLYDMIAHDGNCSSPTMIQTMQIVEYIFLVSYKCGACSLCWFSADTLTLICHLCCYVPVCVLNQQ